MGTCAFAQEPTEFAGKFYGPLISGDWSRSRAITPRAASIRIANAIAATTTSPCSVPLLDAQRPKDIGFTARQIHPRTDKLAKMPQFRVPAPSCDAPQPAAPK